LNPCMDKMPPPAIADSEDAHTIDRKSARGAPVEFIVRGERRRVWSPEQKRGIVAESLGPELTPTEVARKYGIGSGLLYTWRSQMLTEPSGVVTRSNPNFAQSSWHRRRFSVSDAPWPFWIFGDQCGFGGTQSQGRSSSRRFCCQPLTRRVSTSLMYGSGLTPLSLQVSIRDAMQAQFSPPWSEPGS